MIYEDRRRYVIGVDVHSMEEYVQECELLNVIVEHSDRHAGIFNYDHPNQRETMNGGLEGHSKFTVYVAKSEDSRFYQLLYMISWEEVRQGIAEGQYVVSEKQVMVDVREVE